MIDSNGKVSSMRHNTEKRQKDSAKTEAFRQRLYQLRYAYELFGLGVMNKDLEFIKNVDYLIINDSGEKIYVYSTVEIMYYYELYLQEYLEKSANKEHNPLSFSFHADIGPSLLKKAIYRNQSIS